MATWEGDLAPVNAQPGGALSQKYSEPLIGLDQRDEDGGPHQICHGQLDPLVAANSGEDVLERPRFLSFDGRYSGRS